MSLFPYHEQCDDTQHLVQERLIALEQAIPASSEAIRPTLLKIHRSAVRLHGILTAIDVSLPLPSAPFGRISCFDCGTRKMETFHTSKQGGYHLCPPCFEDRVGTGRARSAH
jgi:hypothetical protein